MEQSWCDTTYLPIPFELLGIFRDADYVVTDTFHGTVFSLKYQKPFVTFVRESNKQKLIDLLETFSLTNRIVSDTSKLAKQLKEKLNREAIQTTIARGIRKTESYFEHNLSSKI